MRVEISADINKSTNLTSNYLSINTLNKYLLCVVSLMSRCH